MTRASFILQAQFTHDNQQKSVEAHGETGFHPGIHIDQLITSGDAIGLEIAINNCWYSKLEDQQSNILAIPAEYRPGAEVRDLEKSIDTEAKLINLQYTL